MCLLMVMVMGKVLLVLSDVICLLLSRIVVVGLWLVRMVCRCSLFILK